MKKTTLLRIVDEIEDDFDVNDFIEKIESQRDTNLWLAVAIVAAIHANHKQEGPRKLVVNGYTAEITSDRVDDIICTIDNYETMSRSDEFNLVINL